MKTFVLIYRQKPLYKTLRIKEEAIRRRLRYIEGSYTDFTLSDNEMYFKGEKIGRIDFFYTQIFRNPNAHLFIDHVESNGGISLPRLNEVKYNDKFFAIQAAKKYGIDVPATVLFEGSISKEQIEEELGGFPVIVKATKEDNGEGVYMAENMKQLDESLKKTPRPTIVQECIKESLGRDVRVVFVKDNILGAIERTAKEGFKANVHLGGKVKEIELDPDLKKKIINFIRKTGLTMGGFDFLESKRGFLLTEINMNCGVEGFEKATGIDVTKEIFDNIYK